MNLTKLKSAQTYADNTKAILSISSAVTGFTENFPAFLTDFSQNFQSNWSTEEVYGRNDPIATFQGTKRTISLAFDIPSIHAEDAKSNLLKTSNLIKMLYPGYIDVTENDNNKKKTVIGSVMAKSPLVKVKFANLIVSQSGKDGLLGWISSINWKPNLEMGMFAKDGKFYPKVISITFELNVLHRDKLSQGRKATGDVNTWLGGSADTRFPFGG